MINIADLIGFINEAGKAGYEQDKPKNIKKESDGSTTIWHERGDWKLHDNFFGGEPYGGRTIIHYKYKPVHITVYYGFVDKNLGPNIMYPFLRKALRSSEQKLFRGPKQFKEGAFLYARSYKGTVKDFVLKEKIFEKKKLIYQATFIGGLVDQRAGD